MKCFAFFPKLKVCGDPQGLKRTNKKNNTPNVNACAEIHFQMKISDLNAYTNPKKARFSSNSIFKFYLQTALFKFYLQNCTLEIFND
eukprot:UN09504